MEAVALVRLALSVITDRLIVILALVMSCGLACWTMWGPTWERVVTLTIFVIFSYLVTKTRDNRNERQATQAAQ